MFSGNTIHLKHIFVAPFLKSIKFSVIDSTRLRMNLTDKKVQAGNFFKLLHVA